MIVNNSYLVYLHFITLSPISNSSFKVFYLIKFYLQYDSLRFRGLELFHNYFRLEKVVSTSKDVNLFKRITSNSDLTLCVQNFNNEIQYVS